ncbi:MAG: hypothetical protein ACPGYY_02690, partial [Bacteroidia bacterium]
MEEIIEKYLLGQLPKSEKLAFERRIQSDSNLATEVSLQLELMEAVRLEGLKTEISNAFKKIRVGKMIKTAVISTLIASVIGLGIYYINKSLHKSRNLDTIGATLPTNDFKIDNSKDTVIETANGIILHIPANAFGNVSGYELEVKEALNALDIMEAGLNTMS